MTLREALAKRGLTAVRQGATARHRKSRLAKLRILAMNGVVVYEGRAADVWKWLAKRK